MERLAEFHFLRPEFLWMIVPGLLLYWLVRRQQDVRDRWKHVIDAELLDHLVVGRPSGFRLRPVHLVCAAIILGAIGAAGPTWRREQPPFTEDKAPMVIALDLSATMDAIDLQPTRLERAKLKIRDLLDLRQGGRTALFVYAGSAHMVLPLTEDRALIQTFLDSLSTGLMPVPGKNTAAALEEADAFLKRDPVPGTILFVTDGVERGAFTAFAAHKKSARDEVMVLAAGTVEGGPVQTGAGQFLSDRTGRRIFSKLDVEGLRALKKDVGIPVTMLTVDDDDIRWVQRRVQSHLQVKQQGDTQARWNDAGYWLVIPVALLGALWFRKGWTIRWASALLLLGIPAQSQAIASEWRFADLWATHDQQGRYYFDRGDFAKAAERFSDPLWKGLALYRKGDFEGALNQFALVDSAESWFNQGNCLARLGKYPEAVRAYDEALKRRTAWSDARENRDLVQSLIPPPPKDKEEEGAPDVHFKPDEVKFDEKGKKGKSGEVDLQKLNKQQMEDVWMRNVQTTPAEFLRQKFLIQSEKSKKR